MSWDHFKTPRQPWTLSRSSHPGLRPPAVLTFVGGGSGGEDSKMTTGTGADWGTRAEYIGGSGTDTDPDVVNLTCGGTDFHIRRIGGRLACYPGKAAPGSSLWRNDEGGEGTQPIWEAQEGG